MAADIDARIAKQRRGDTAAWAIIDAASGKAVGMTTYLNLDPDNRRLEIGSTWLGRNAQGTSINPATKLLLLTRAFETLGCLGVEFRTHWHNHQSRAAIEHLGAKQDGVLRKHKILPNGTIRDTVVYSITDDEWAGVKLGLEQRLADHAGRR
jgi:RimJ/RimL family protein N-acetyltransferase